MARLIWALACRRVIVDAGTNLASYIDAIEGVRLPEFPTAAPPMNIASLWERTGEGVERIETRVSVEAPEQGPILKTESAAVELQPQHKRGRVHIGLADLPLPDAGKYHILIEVKEGSEWKEAWRIPWDVQRQPAPPTEAPSDQKAKAAASARKKRQASSTQRRSDPSN